MSTTDIAAIALPAVGSATSCLFAFRAGNAAPMPAATLNSMWSGATPHARAPRIRPCSFDSMAGHVSSHPRSASWHDFAEFGQQTPQAVDLGGAELHQLLAHPMQRQNPLLFFALDGNRLDPGLLNRGPDRPRVVGIVLVAADERPHHLRRQQTGLVAQLL